MSVELTLKGKIVVGFVGAIVVLGIFSWMDSSTMKAPPITGGEDGYQSGTATGFYKVPPQDAEQIINTKPNLVIIDCSIGGSEYQAGQTLPRAIWSPDPAAFFNQRKDVLLYANDDEVAIDYGRRLVGKLYGEIYILLGGYPAWDSWIHRSP